MSKLRKAVIESVHRAIKSQMPDTYDGMPVEMFFGDEAVHIKVKTPKGMRLFDVQVSEVYR